MKYSRKVVDKANTILQQRQEKAEKEAASRHTEFIKKHPELTEIEAEMSRTGADILKAVQGCENPREYIDSLSRKNLEFQRLKKELLKSEGFDGDYLDIHYTCPKCKDTGYVDGVVCSCYEELLKKLSYEDLAEKTSLKISSFDEFDISLYNDETKRAHMQKILNYCKDYAEEFDGKGFPSVYMFGETGLGKTHLSLAIAGKVIEKGYNVIYGSAHNFFNMLEREHFGRSENPDGTTEEKLLNCDLLILDDLGAEFVTQYTIAELYNIIDTRLAKDLPTIISSNIKSDELESKYNNRIASRILYSYYRLCFMGNDIRQALSQEN